MKITIVLDSEDPKGIADAMRVVEIMRVRAGVPGDPSKKLTRLKLIRIIQDYAKLIAFEAGYKDFKDASYTRLKEVKDFVDHVWRSLE